MEAEKKSILFVINTLGNAGAEAALLNLLRQLDPAEYDLYLYVLLGQGELVHQLPPTVTLLNPVFNSTSVLTVEGRRAMMKTVAGAFFRNGQCLHKLQNIFAALRSRKNCPFDKMLWRTVSDGALRFNKRYDLAVAYIEGGSTYYVADHVKARKKAAFVHIDYESSGYTRAMDQGCYDKVDCIFAVSAETQTHFLRFYPEYAEKTAVFHNILDRARILQRAQEPGGFADAYDGLRLLTVGRLTYQKGYDIAIEAMRRVKQAGCKARWYVLGGRGPACGIGKADCRGRTAAGFHTVGRNG